MLPLIALVGRPNVGKSTLFNGLTRTRNALVADTPGLTRDRQYGVGKVGDRPYLVVDTGGLTLEGQGIAGLIARQVRRALEEADVVLLLVDGQTGLTGGDEDIAAQLRRLGKPVQVVVNKAEQRDPDTISAEFHALGLGEPIAISAAHNYGVAALMERVLELAPLAEQAAAEPPQEKTIRLAVVGRPNVGKSTLINRLLGEERLLTYDAPGTTRDSVAVPFEKDGQSYTLIDTAGVRRRSRVDEAIEKFSVIKTLQAIEQAHVVILLLDARQGVAEQDATLLGHVLDSGRGLVIAVNKWDSLDGSTRRQVRQDLDRKLDFVNFARVHFISALHGSGIMDLLPSVLEAYRAATAKFATAELTRLLQEAVGKHQPPLVQGRGSKLRYAHQGGQNPPVIVIHGNRVEHVSNAYRRYLANYFRKALNLWGTPLRIEFRGGENPYQPDKKPRPSVKRNSRR